MVVGAGAVGGSMRAGIKAFLSDTIASLKWAKLAWPRRALPIKTSMLQDLEAGRRLELDALTDAVVRKGAALGVPVPTVATLHALLAAQSRS